MFEQVSWPGGPQVLLWQYCTLHGNFHLFTTFDIPASIEDFEALLTLFKLHLELAQDNPEDTAIVIDIPLRHTACMTVEDLQGFIGSMEATLASYREDFPVGPPSNMPDPPA